MTRRRVVLPAVVALGSNLGDRQATLRQAVALIDSISGVTVTAVSGLVESHAVKPTGTDSASPNYLNAVILLDSSLDPESLLRQLNVIESQLGRVRVERWGDRTLDLDIIDFAGLQLHSPTLTLPHPLAGHRPFVIVPWLQVHPDAVLPALGRIDTLEARSSADVWAFEAGAPFDRAGVAVVSQESRGQVREK